jgi:hypothetical protein
MLSFEFYPERDMKSMAYLEIYLNFYKKYPKRDRKKLAFIGCFDFIEKFKKMTKRSIFSLYWYMNKKLKINILYPKRAIIKHVETEKI